MKKLIALLLLLSMILCLTSCFKKGNEVDTFDPVGGTSSGNDDSNNGNVTIVVPEYKDYGRGTVNFENLLYTRPNIEGLVKRFNDVTLTVEANEKSVAEQIADIRALEYDFANIKSMYSLAEIYQNQDSSVAYWQSEYAYITTNYPKLTQAVEDLLVACAVSENKAVFETDYFNYSLDDYVDGGIYTDEVVSLMEEEARLESKYSSFSTSNVEIVYKRTGTNKVWEGTVEEVLAELREYFGTNVDLYESARITVIETLYQQKLAELEAEVYVELIKVRRLIADELGYASYSELAYESRGYDYTAADMLALLDNIGTYVSPVARDLEYMVFYSYFSVNVQPTVNSAILVNTLYQVYTELGGDYADAYSYMLQHGLYDIEYVQDNRYAGAFTTYIDNNNSPFLFMTTSGFIRDYTTLAHEFGHFYDGYVNYGNDESLAISEVSSQALELLTVLKLKNKLKAQPYQYLEYYTMSSFINNVILAQSFYAAFEHMAYNLSYDEITETRLKKLMEEAFSFIYGDDLKLNGDLSTVAIPHTVLYPFYVESYVTSGFVSLDIFFAESYRTGEAGQGFALYETLLNREGTELTFLDRLEVAGIDSPFAIGKAKEIANSIYFQLTAKNYYKPAANGMSAA